MKRVFVTTTASVIIAVVAVVALILVASALGGLWVLGFVGGVLGLFAALARQLHGRLRHALPAGLQSYARVIALLIGAAFAVLPLVHGPDAAGEASPAAALSLVPGAVEAIMATVYTAIQVTILQLDLSSWFDSVDAAGLASVLALPYDVMLCAYAFVLPVVTAYTALTTLIDDLSGIALKASSWRQARHDGDIFVVQGLSERSCTFASSVFDRYERAGKGMARPVVIFCDIAADDLADVDARKQALRERGGNVATLLFTPVAIEDVPEDLAKRARERCRVHYLAITDDTSRNVRSAIKVTDSLVRILELDELERKLEWGLAQYEAKYVSKDKKGNAYDDPANLLPSTRIFASRQSVYCAHGNPDDDLIFDSLPQRGPDDAVRLAAEEHDCVTGPDKTLDEALAPLERLIRSQLEVRLFDEVQENVYDLLTEHPLFDVLDEPSDMGSSKAAQPTQLLTVLVVGLGAYGTQALRTAFWMGRLPGVELRIIGVDECGTVIESRLGSSCPEMMGEAVPTGMEGVCQGLGSMAPQDRPCGKPTVRILELDARSTAFERLLLGNEVNGTTIPDNARVYSVVALGNDELNLNVALHIQRTLARRSMAGTFKRTYPTDRPVGRFGRRNNGMENPITAPVIKSSTVLESVEHLQSDGVAFAIYPFGANEHVFSYEGLVEDTWERRAVQAHVCYHLASTGEHLSEMEAKQGKGGYFEKEINKYSNRAFVRAIVYKLWMAGIEAPENPTDIRAFSDYGVEWATMLGLEGKVPATDGRDRAEDGDEDNAGLLLEGGLTKEVAPARRRDDLLAQERNLRERHPVLCRLGDYEHARWDAFYRAQGWHGVRTPDELARLNIELGTQFDIEHAKGERKSELLHQHYYLVDNLSTLLEHGANFATNPFTYDRMLVAYALLIMACKVTE